MRASLPWPAGRRQAAARGHAVKEAFGNSLEAQLEKCVVMRLYRPDGSNFGINVMFSNAGFRPGSRATFVSAKVTKTSDAPSGYIKMGRTQA